MSFPLIFGRAWKVQVGTLEATDIDIAFQVKKTLKPEPNTCDLKLYNLTSDHRKAIEQQASRKDVLVTTTEGTQEPFSGVAVRIQAGYKDHLSTIFEGVLRMAWSVTDGPDIVTELATGDGEAQAANSRVNVSFGQHTSIGTVMRELAAILGTKNGNLDRTVALLQAKGFTEFSSKGVVLKGNVANHLNDFCRSVGLEWSIQDGALQFLELGQPIEGEVLSLDSDSGLIGSPSVDSKGVLSFSCLMVPGVKPGAVVKIDGAHVTGNYRIQVVESVGDTLGNDWYHKCQAVKF